MTSRRRKRATQFSLFAFQDIITSVTGIVMLMVLLLTLELVDRPLKADSMSADIYDQLKNTVKSTQQDIDLLRARTGKQESLIEEVAKTSQPELKQEINVLRDELEELQKQIAQIEEVRRQLEEKSRQIDARDHDQQEITKEIQRLQAEYHRLKSAIEQLESRNRIVFSVPKGESRDGWLAVVGKTTVEVAPLDRPAVPITFRSNDGLLASTKSTDLLIEWIEQNRSTVRYMLVIIRPGGVQSFEELEPEFRRMKIDYGFDLVDEDEVVLDPEKGAVQ